MKFQWLKLKSLTLKLHDSAKSSKKYEYKKLGSGSLVNNRRVAKTLAYRNLVRRHIPCCSWSHGGCGQKRFKLVWWCQQLLSGSFAPSGASVTSAANDKDDNEMILGAVHRSPGIFLTAEENPRKPQLGDRLMKGLCEQSSPQMGSLSSSNEVYRIAQHVRKGEGRNKEIGRGARHIPSHIPHNRKRLTRIHLWAVRVNPNRNRSCDSEPQT